MHSSYHYFIEDQKYFPTKSSPFAARPGTMINPQWLELPMSRTNFHGSKDVPAFEVYSNMIWHSLDLPYWVAVPKWWDHTKGIIIVNNAYLAQMCDKFWHGIISLTRHQKQHHVMVTFEGIQVSVQYELSEPILSDIYILTSLILLHIFIIAIFHKRGHYIIESFWDLYLSTACMVG